MINLHSTHMHTPAAQSTMVVAVTCIAASPFAESKDIHLSYTVHGVGLISPPMGPLGP
jgi:hypothetical protein